MTTTGAMCWISYMDPLKHLDYWSRNFKFLRTLGRFPQDLKGPELQGNSQMVVTWPVTEDEQRSPILEDGNWVALTSPSFILCLQPLISTS